MTMQADLKEANAIRSSSASLAVVLTIPAALETIPRHGQMPLITRLDCFKVSSSLFWMSLTWKKRSKHCPFFSQHHESQFPLSVECKSFPKPVELPTRETASVFRPPLQRQLHSDLFYFTTGTCLISYVNTNGSLLT